MGPNTPQLCNLVDSESKSLHLFVLDCVQINVFFLYSFIVFLFF